MRYCWSKSTCGWARVLSRAGGRGKAGAALGSIGGGAGGAAAGIRAAHGRRCCHLMTKVTVIVVDGREFVAVTCAPARKIFDLSNACPINPAGWLLPAILIRINTDCLPPMVVRAVCVFYGALPCLLNNVLNNLPIPRRKRLT